VSTIRYKSFGENEDEIYLVELLEMGDFGEALLLMVLFFLRV